MTDAMRPRVKSAVPELTASVNEATSVPSTRELSKEIPPAEVSSVLKTLLAQNFQEAGGSAAIAGKTINITLGIGGEGDHAWKARNGKLRLPAILKKRNWNSRERSVVIQIGDVTHSIHSDREIMGYDDAARAIDLKDGTFKISRFQPTLELRGSGNADNFEAKKRLEIIMLKAGIGTTARLGSSQGPVPKQLADEPKKTLQEKGVPDIMIGRLDEIYGRFYNQRNEGAFELKGIYRDLQTGNFILEGTADKLMGTGEFSTRVFRFEVTPDGKVVDNQSKEY